LIRNDDFEFINKSIMERRNDYYRIALSFCGNRDDALDCVSEMTVIVIERFGSLKNKDAFVSWSKQILINQCRKNLRQRKRIVFIDDLETEIAGPEMNTDISADMQIALSSIKPIYKEVIVLKAVLQYTYKEIAEILRTPVFTVQYRYDYGIKCLRKKIGGKYYDES